MRITAFARTDVGKVRPENEDDFFVGRQVFAVADGMGGHAAGEVAAKTALEPLVSIDSRTFDSADAAEEALAEAVREANRQVVEMAEAQPELHGMGTTLTAALLRDGRLHLAHVGDSRAYLLRDGEAITQLTTDHTLVERLVREGRLSREEVATHPQRNVITRAIGNEPDVVVDSLPALRLQSGDQVLLCSDGLTGPLGDADIAATLTHTPDGDEAVTSLISQANEAGGPDNITAIVLRVEGEDDDPVVAVKNENVRQIRTRHDGDETDWAKRLGRLGAPQGVETRKDKKARSERASGGGGGGGRRVFAVLLALLLLLGVVAGGGWMLLSRAYFVGAYEEQVAIYRGVPEEVWNIRLNQVIDEEVTDLDLDEFPDWRRSQIEDGITARTIDEARRIVRTLEGSIGDRQPVDDPDGGTDEPADEAGDEGAEDT
jgi:PPM family protein phosphatase